MPNPLVVYPPFLASVAHPDRMAVRAHLRGFSAPDPNRCRVLELGCGAGWSSLAFGYSLPGSEFIGIDLSEPAIAQGQDWAARLGLSNVHLRQGDVREIGEADGQFDYIFAHGLLSWVPEPVRQKVFEICRDRLAPTGVAYLSYNAYPAGHMRQMVREMLRFHTRAKHSDADRIAQGHGLMRALVETPVPGTTYHQHLVRVAERMEEMPPEQILFDELAEENQHYYFHEFVSRAASYGLEYLADAEFAELSLGLPAKTQAVLARIPDRLTREQYLDFFIGRAFRQTMLCRTGQQQPRPSHAETLRGLWLGGPMELVPPPTEESGDGAQAIQKWSGAIGGTIGTAHAPTQAAFARLGSAWPACIEGQEILTAAPTEDDTETLAGMLVQCVHSGVLRAHVHPPPAAHSAGEKPRASAMVRAMIGQRFVPNLASEAIAISSEADEQLLRLLDGARTRAELAAGLGIGADKLDADLRRFVRLELLEEHPRG